MMWLLADVQDIGKVGWTESVWNMLSKQACANTIFDMFRILSGVNVHFLSAGAAVGV